MLTRRLRRRRHALDTYIHVELEDPTPLAGNAPVPVSRETAEAPSKAADKRPITHARAS